MALADFAEKVFDRHLAIVENQRASGRSANAHLVFFGADGKAREISFDQERRELLAIDFCKHGKEIGEAGVRDPHLFAVQDVVLAVL